MADAARVGLSYNGARSYPASDHLGSREASLDANGNVEGAKLYDPYGANNYTSGWTPGSFGYTGQRSDARPRPGRLQRPLLRRAAGQFASADPLHDGMAPPNRYGYVHGGPETFTDPTGQQACGEAGCRGGATQAVYQISANC